MDNNIFSQLRGIGILARRKMDSSATMKDQKLTRLHCMVLRYLSQNKDKDVFQKDIEAKFTIRRSTSTQLLKLMQSNGLINKEKVPYDARLVKITLTDKANSFHKRIYDEISKMDEQMVKGLTQQEIDEFMIIIEKIKKNLE